MVTSGRRRFTNERAREIKALIEQGYTRCVLAKQYRCSAKVIDNIRNGRHGYEEIEFDQDPPYYSGRRRFSIQQILEIRIAKGLYPVKKLAEMQNCSVNTIMKIWHRLSPYADNQLELSDEQNCTVQVMTMLGASHEYIAEHFECSLAAVVYALGVK